MTALPRIVPKPDEYQDEDLMPPSRLQSLEAKVDALSASMSELRQEVAVLVEHVDAHDRWSAERVKDLDKAKVLGEENKANFEKATSNLKMLLWIGGVLWTALAFLAGYFGKK